jgi:anti-sigma regulatory factor (Ser/Thr protein kinase)
MATAIRTYSSELSQLAQMREFVGEVCVRVWPEAAADSAIRELQLALCEAAANVVRHAYEDAPGRCIDLEIEADSERVRLTLRHDGVPFDPTAAVPPDFDGSREGGFGVYMMEQLADEVAYLREADGRSAVRLVKKRPPRT